MTIYRRRLASSFAALEHTLNQRINTLETGNTSLVESNEENLSDDDNSDEAMDDEEANQLEIIALKAEEVHTL